MCTCTEKEKKIESEWALVWPETHAAHTMHQKYKHAKKVSQRERTRSRDEKYAGWSGPPDCAEVEAEAEEQAEVEIVVDRAAEFGWGCEKEESVGDWDIVGGGEHLHSPRSCHPPCTSRTPARCTVS